MATLKKYRASVTLLCLVAALFCYLVGAQSGLLLFVILGCGLEMAFWFRLIGQR